MVASGHFENIIKWTSKGKAFQITNKDKFVMEVLPLVFSKAAKFSSFHRKVRIKIRMPESCLRIFLTSSNDLIRSHFFLA